MTDDVNPRGLKGDNPIKVPVAVVWRQLRMQWVPPIVLLLTIAGVAIQWRTIGSAGVTGVAEGVRSTVTAPQPALLHEVNVEPYQKVDAGEPLAILFPMDPRSEMDLIQSELQLTRLKIEPTLAERSAVDYERLRVEALRLKREVAVAQVNLQRAETALKRSSALRLDKLVSEDDYDLGVRDRDLYQVEIKEKLAAIADLEDRLRQLAATAQVSSNGHHAIQQLVKRLEGAIEKSRADGKSLLVTAPISGTVQFISRRPGEYVSEGEPLFTIVSPEAQRIVAYLRQPYGWEPHVGMKVKVRTKEQRSRWFVSEVTHIGSHLEAITNSLAMVRSDYAIDMGLPVVVDLPPAVGLRPGESVEIVRISERESRSEQGAGSNPL